MVAEEVSQGSAMGRYFGLESHLARIDSELLSPATLPKLLSQVTVEF